MLSPGPRERDASACKEAPGFRPGRVRERRFRVCEEAPGFRPGSRETERETRPRG